MANTVIYQSGPWVVEKDDSGFAFVSTYGATPVMIRDMNGTNFNGANTILAVGTYNGQQAVVFQGSSSYHVWLCDGNWTKLTATNLSPYQTQVAFGVSLGATPEYTYSITQDANLINEGQTVHFTIRSNDAPDGTVVTYQVFGGVTASELVGNPTLTGTATMSNHMAVVSLTPSEDHFTDGTDTMGLNILVNGQTVASSTNVTINDTSKTTVLPVTPNNPTTVESFGATKLLKDAAGVFFVQQGGGPIYAVRDVDGSVVNYGILAADTYQGKNAVVFENGYGPSPNIYHVWFFDETWTKTTTVNLSPSEVEAAFGINVGASSLPSFSVTANSAQVNEGDNVTFTIATKNVPNGTMLMYQLRGSAANLNDFQSSRDANGALTSIELSGRIAVNNNTATLTLTLAKDGVTENDENLNFILFDQNNMQVAQSPNITIKDTSNAANTKVEAINPVVVESSGTWTLLKDSQGINFAQKGSATPIAIRDMGGEVTRQMPLIAADTYQGKNAVVFGNIDGTYQDSYHVWLCDGNWTKTDAMNITPADVEQYFGVSVGAANRPSYTFTVNTLSVNEGQTIQVNIVTKNVADGTSLRYDVFGSANSMDFVGNPMMNGNFVIANNQATLTWTTLEDATTEWQENFNINFMDSQGRAIGATSSIQINDTSKTPNIPLELVNGTLVESSGAYQLLKDSSGAYFSKGAGDSKATVIRDMGGNIWRSGPIIAADIYQGKNAVVFGNGANTITASSFHVWLCDENWTKIDALNISAISVEKEFGIDVGASKMAGYELSASTYDVNEGGHITITLATNNVADGTVLNYNLFGGVMAIDFLNNQMLSGSVVVNGGKATIDLAIAEDNFTESQENLGIQVMSKDGLPVANLAGIIIRDTSKGSVVNLAPVGPNLVESNGSWKLYIDQTGAYFAQANGGKDYSVIRDAGGTIWRGGAILAVEQYQGKNAVVFGSMGGGANQTFHVWLCDSAWTKLDTGMNTANISADELQQNFGITVNSGSSTGPIGATSEIESSGAWTLLRDASAAYFAKSKTGEQIIIKDFGGPVWRGAAIIAADTYMGQNAFVLGVGSGSSVSSYQVTLCDSNWTKVSIINLGALEIQDKFGINVAQVAPLAAPVGASTLIETSGNFSLKSDATGAFFAVDKSGVEIAIKDFGGGVWRYGPIIAVDTYQGKNAVVFGDGAGSNMNSYHVWICDNTWTKTSALNITPTELIKSFGVTPGNAPQLDNNANNLAQKIVTMTGQILGAPISTTVSQNLTLGSGSIFLKDSNGVMVKELSAASPLISLSNGVFTIQSSEDLSYGRDYQIEFGPGVLVDLAGNQSATSQSFNAVTPLPTPTVFSSGKTKTIIGTADDDIIEAGLYATGLSGDKGNDAYIITNKSAKITENEGSGVDTIISSIATILPNNVENLTLFNNQNIAGTGNALNNVIVGNSSNNIIGGKLGNDTLTGGAGADTFLFDTKPDITNNIDTVTDFIPDIDKIKLAAAIFKGLKGAQSWLESGDGLVAATKLTTKVIYDSATGYLYYDSDGNKTTVMPVLVAIIGQQDHPDISVSDFTF